MGVFLVAFPRLVEFSYHHQKALFHGAIVDEI